MGQGDDGTLVPPTDDQTLELGAQGAVGTTGGVGAFAEDPTDIRVALAGSPTFPFSGRLIVPGTKAGPGGQSIGAPKDAHVVSDFDQQQGSTHGIDARQGLQEFESILLRLQALQQLGIEALDLGLQRLDMAERLVQDKAVTGTQLALQGIQDLLLAGFEPSAGQSEYGLRGTSPESGPGSWAGPIAHGYR